MFVSDTHKAVFIHHRKTGGTSMHNIFGSNKEWKLVEGMHSNIEAIEQKLPELHKKIKDNNYEIFGIIRNPWSAAVSYYFHMLHPLQFFVENPFRINRTILNNLTVEKYNNLHEDCTFTNFIKGKYQNKICQISSEIYENDLKYTKFYRFENLAKEWEIISDKYNLNPNLPSINIGSKKMNVLGISYPLHYSELYDDETKEIVYNVNKEYTDRFNYKF